MKTFMLLLALFIFGTLTVNAQVAVIVNKSVSESSLSKAQIVNLFLMNTKKWSNGSKVVVFDLKPNTPAKSKFYGYLGQSPVDVRKKWMKLQLTGEGKAPDALSSEEDVLAKVGATSGGIGFVSASKVSGNVKVVATIQ